LIPEAPADHQIEREFLAKGRPSSLLQWMIEPEEIANPIAYVASPCLQRPMAPPCAWMVVSHLRSANRHYGNLAALITTRGESRPHSGSILPHHEGEASEARNLGSHLRRDG
jgi:hypothetical protein